MDQNYTQILEGRREFWKRTYLNEWLGGSGPPLACDPQLGNGTCVDNLDWGIFHYSASENH